MRVIAGEWRGRGILVPKQSVRPTQDRVRQILFDIVGPRIVQGWTLDLYAGSGALGIEALSRGASHAVFVEIDGGVRRTLERNLDHVQAGARARVVGRPVLAALPELLAEGIRFRWVFADPPYGSPDVEPVLSWLGGPGNALLEGTGGVVWESSRRDPAPGTTGLLQSYRERIIGDTVLRFFRSEIPGADLAEKGGT